MDRIKNRFKVRIYGNNVKTVAETCGLGRYGKKYSQIELQEIVHKEASNG